MYLLISVLVKLILAEVHVAMVHVICNASFAMGVTGSHACFCKGGHSEESEAKARLITNAGTR